MEGIQHRSDCPDPNAEPVYEQTYEGLKTVYVQMRCPHCGRAALTQQDGFEESE
jgi:hypothetical protein